MASAWFWPQDVLGMSGPGLVLEPHGRLRAGAAQKNLRRGRTKHFMAHLPSPMGPDAETTDDRGRLFQYRKGPDARNQVPLDDPGRLLFKRGPSYRHVGPTVRGKDPSV